MLSSQNGESAVGMGTSLRWYDRPDYCRKP